MREICAVNVLSDYTHAYKLHIFVGNRRDFGRVCVQQFNIARIVSRCRTPIPNNSNNTLPRESAVVLSPCQDFHSPQKSFFGLASMHLIDFVMQSVCNAYLLAKCSQTQFYSIKKKRRCMSSSQQFWMLTILMSPSLFFVRSSYACWLRRQRIEERRQQRNRDHSTPLAINRVSGKTTCVLYFW